MDTKKEFFRMMREHSEIALATSLNNTPNVRTVNFYFDPDEKVLYFATFSDNTKVFELEKNTKVAFTTIPKHGTEHIKAKGICTKSSKTVYDLKEQLIGKMEGYRELIEDVGAFLVVYEIHFEKAQVVLTLENIDTYTL